ncbi:MAG: phosphomannomutase [Candidatus Woesearchaeota archaeon]|nr:MAG: phosphomannomutase [Candidatus Woesearchaeota archaeon]
MSIFRAYDIRGIYGKELTDDIAEKIGYAIIHFTRAKNVVVGYDSRLSSINIFSAFSRGVINSGANIINIGLVTKPMLNWVSIKEGYDLGVMITASHNPKEYNGFNFMRGRNTLHYLNGLNDVEKLMNKKFTETKNKGKIINMDYTDEYVDFLSSKITAKNLSKIKVIGDASNGTAGQILKKLFKKNKIKGEILFSEPDGRFPNHDTNTMVDSAFSHLIKKVVSEKADFGFMVDPDSDRARFVDEKGNIIDNSYIQSLIIKYLINKEKSKEINDKKKYNIRKGKKIYIVRELTSRRIVSETIIENGGVDIISKIGHPYIIDMMNKYDAIYGCESSGHNFFNDIYNLDSGEMMFIKVLNMYSDSDKKLSEMILPLEKYVSLGEIVYSVKNYKKTTIDYSKIIEKIEKYFSERKKGI